MRKFSLKRQKENRIYAVLRKDYLADHPFCEVCQIIRTIYPAIACEGESTQVHHAAGRIGKLLTEIKYFVPTCGTGHIWVEMHPKESKELGLSESRLAK